MNYYDKTSAPQHVQDSHLIRRYLLFRYVTLQFNTFHLFIYLQTTIYATEICSGAGDNETDVIIDIVVYRPVARQRSRNK
jgi:hypothetical protein